MGAEMTKAVLAYLAELRAWIFLAGSLPVCLATSLLIVGLGSLCGLTTENMYRPESVIATGPVGLLFFGSVVAPLFETLVFQQWPKRILDRYQLGGFWTFALLSAATFATAHSLHPMSFLSAMGGGLVLALSFAARDHPGGRPFWLTAGVHSLRNTFSTLLFYLW